MSRDIPTEKSIESKQMVLPLLPGIPLQTLTQQYLNANGQTFNEDWLMKRNQQSKYPSIVETSPESKGYRLVAADLLPAGTIVERFEGNFTLMLLYFTYTHRS